jgi:hypothetical protein
VVCKGATAAAPGHAKEVLGMTPGELRVSLSPDQALSIVRERYFTTPSEAERAS